MQAKKLKDVKRGEFIKRTPDTGKVYTKGEYDRGFKKYRCDDHDDISRDILLNGNTTVYVGFTY